MVTTPVPDVFLRLRLADEGCLRVARAIDSRGVMRFGQLVVTTPVPDVFLRLRLAEKPGGDAPRRAAG